MDCTLFEVEEGAPFEPQQVLVCEGQVFLHHRSNHRTGCEKKLG